MSVLSLHNIHKQLLIRCYNAPFIVCYNTVFESKKTKHNKLVLLRIFLSTTKY